MAGHTPGPWVVSGYTVTKTMLERLSLGSVHWAVAQGDEDGMLIALCGDEPGTDSTDAKDARLIAAAPAMYEALRDAAQFIKDLDDDLTSEVDEETGWKSPEYMDVYLAIRKALALAEKGAK